MTSQHQGRQREGRAGQEMGRRKCEAGDRVEREGVKRVSEFQQSLIDGVYFYNIK